MVEEYIGESTRNACLVHLKAGNNLLFVGPKATGKNVLARNLASIMGKKIYEVSFHEGVEGKDLVSDNSAIVKAARDGCYCVLDEINMTNSSCLAILHGLAMGHIDLGMGNTIKLNKDTRFIATMNYGYEGTKELNEALVSRFQVITIPEHTADTLYFVLESRIDGIKPEILEKLSKFFLKVQERAKMGLISTRAVDLRGMINAVNAIKYGITLHQALMSGMINKVFDAYDIKVLIEDMKYIFPIDLYFDDIKI